ncbi:MAG: TIGR01777 family oxidoreductase [Desulfovibrionaceae bacterium]
MRVVIAGGTGLIGRALTRALIRDGHAVAVLTRRPTGRMADSGATLVPWDGRTGKGWVPALDGADSLVNLAGENIASGLWTRSRKARILDSRLAAGQACLEAISRVERRPASLIQASAVGYYGDRGETALTEDAAPGRGFLADVASRWEASTAEAENMGVRRVVVRTAVVLARKGGALPRMLPAFRLGLGGPLGSGRQYFPWIHLADEVGAIRFLMAQPGASGVFNLAAPETVTQRDWARALGRAVGRPAWLPLPATLLRLALGAMGQELFLSGARVVPRKLLDLGFGFHFPNLVGALRDLCAKRGDA